MALVDQFLTQLTIIVDLSVHHGTDCRGLIHHRLFAALRIDHTEAMDTKSYTRLPITPDLIRPSVNEPAEHAL
jgi:hypothetical protein